MFCPPTLAQSWMTWNKPDGRHLIISAMPGKVYDTVADWFKAHVAAPVVTSTDSDCPVPAHQTKCCNRASKTVPAGRLQAMVVVLCLTT